MHILFITDNFPPEVNAPASRTFEHCRHWVGHGHQVTVITCQPNFPLGKIFPGYKNRLWQKEVIDGVRVIRVWTYMTANEGFAKRITDYLSFMVSALVAAIFVKKVDVVIGTSPQFFTVCAAYMASVLKGIPWIFELRDIWPESIKAVGIMKESIVLRALDRLAIYLYKKANLVIVVSQSFMTYLINLGIDSRNIAVVTNGVDLSRYRNNGRDVDLLCKYKLEEKFIVGYIGTHGLAHGLETLLSAAEVLEKKLKIDNIHFIFIGDGAKKKDLVSHASKKDLRNVLFLDSVNKDQIPNYWALLDVSIIHLRKAPLFSKVIPSKLFEAMGMGIPVLHGVPGESAEIVKRENIGQVFESENVNQLVEAILRMRNDKEWHKKLQENCLIAANHYDRTYLANKMLALILRMKMQ